MATALTRSTPNTAPSVTRLPDMIHRLFSDSFVLPSVFDRSFGQVLGSNLYETAEQYIVQVALPGIDPEQVDIQVSGQQLTIKGSYSVPVPEQATAIWQGMMDGNFAESLTLPGEVEASRAEARYDQGILTITAPKAEHAKPMSIKVQTAR